MPRPSVRRLSVLASLVIAPSLAAGVLVAGPASAQDDPSPAESEQPAEPAEAPVDTTPPVTAVPGDPLVNEGASEELDPNTVDPPDPDAPATETPADGESEAQPECPTEPADPAAAGAEAAPESDPVAECKPKKRGRYANQPEFVPDKLDAAQVRRVEVELAAARADHVKRISRVRSLRLLEKKLDLERDELSAETIETLALLEETEAKLRDRALATFVKGDSFELARSLEHDDILRHQQQRFLVSEVFSLDQELLDEYTAIRARIEEKALELYDRQANVWEWLRGAREKAEGTADRVDRLEFELATWENLSETFIENVVFPIDGVYEEPLINSWGYPRAPGTIDEHWHEGIDIFAPEGEKMVAAEGGTVTDIGVGKLGGLKIWILGDSGTRWYYAHLMGFNPDLAEGDVVKAGDFIGYVGKTGNAIYTPPHLHLQMHPNGGRPVNPFPILQAASDRYQAGIGRTTESAPEVLGFDGTRLLPNGQTTGQVERSGAVGPSPTSTIPLSELNPADAPQTVGTEISDDPGAVGNGIEVDNGSDPGSTSQPLDRARVAGAVRVEDN